MKKNFNKPFSEFYDEPDVDSAWDSMRKVLDEQMPLEPRVLSKRSIIYYITAAAMLLLLLGALVVGKTFYSNEHSYKNFSKNGELANNTVNKRKQKIRATILLNKKCNAGMDGDNFVATIPQTITNKPVEKKTVQTPILQSKNTYRYKEASHIRTSLSSTQMLREADDGSIFFVEAKHDIFILPPEKPLAKVNAIVPETKGIPIIHPQQLRDTSATSFHFADDKDKQLKKIGFNIGLYHNMGGSNKEIYPMVAVTKPLSKKFLVSLGVGFNSRVNINNFAPKEFTVINDTTNQVYFTVVQKHISKAVYIDVPLALNYKINHRVSINAGAQLSILQRVDINAEEKTFDFQSDLSEQISTRITTSTSSYTPNQLYAQDYSFFKINGRFIAGVGYQLKDIGIKFQYAKSFSPNYSLRDFDGTQSQKKLSSFTIGINYRVR